MVNSGYLMFDCGGLDLNDSTEQTIDGIYDRAVEALASGKPVFATNCVMSDMPCSPCSVIAWDQGNDGIIATGHTLLLVIAKVDGVTVLNLVSEVESIPQKGAKQWKYLRYISS